MPRSFACFLVLLAFVTVAAQEPEKYKVETNRVVVDVIVTDKKGHPVHGLTASDFSLMEDGTPQKIESFGTGGPHQSAYPRQGVPQTSRRCLSG